MDHYVIGNKLAALTFSDSAAVKSEDTSLDPQLQQEALRTVLKQQEKERNDKSFSRSCLFCKKHFTGNRNLFYQHLMADHNFHIGSPDNIVYGNELLDILSKKLNNLQCFYCEKTFKDWMTLKEHMRKKQHKRINPRNKTYDKFYMINYLEYGKTWEDVQKEDDCTSDFENDDSELDLMEWNDDEESNIGFLCLFCNTKLSNFDLILQHMKEIHQFDFKETKIVYRLDFYKQVKLINYIRRQVSYNTCIYCEENFKAYQALLTHMETTGHISCLPDTLKWDQAMYYFPTYDNDNFLCALDDISEDNDSSSEAVVLPEDISPISSVLYNEEIRKSLM